MRQIVKMASLAAVMAIGAGVGQSAFAQEFGVRIGPDRPRVVERRVYREERPRMMRPARRTVCTTRWRDGRRVEVCRTEGRRF
jgi:hypothetical protein